MRCCAAMISLWLLAGCAFAAEVRVIDGDTIAIGEERYRLDGIDAPEKAQLCGDWRCGQASTEALTRAIRRGTVRCEVLERDKYDRLIATCFVGDQNLSAMMVESGMAWAFRRYSQTYVSHEDRARANRVGIWQGSYETPWDFRAGRWNTAAQTAPEGCPIKGNISANGRIYHPPWSTHYERTRINLARGERWFCSEDEAIAAGWRPPRGQS